MSDAGKFTQLSGTAPAGKRANAVAAAIEIISARASGAAPVDLETEFNNLKKYADQIQEALKG